MSAQITQKLESLRNKIRHHDYLYYGLAQPVISDKEYDMLMQELKRLEEKYPQFSIPLSPTVRVGGTILEGFKTVSHNKNMLSLDNTYSIDELKEWDARVRKSLGKKEKLDYVAEHKIDGVSANLVYDKGKLIIGATRGDGKRGEDITSNIKTIRAIPLVLLNKNIPDFIEIRGEVYMEKNDFQRLNKEREEQAQVLFANPRNATSGSLKLLDSGLVANRHLNFFAHSLGDFRGKEIKSQWAFLMQLRQWGIRINPYSKLLKTLDEVIRYCNSWQEKRDALSYEIDGMVIKVNGFFQQERLGFTLKSPRWAVAYKFPARQATTEVLKININVGRTGVITPAAELKPVECSGVIISHATLHNFDEIKRLNIREGDRVLIERAGDVIPKVIKVVEARGKRAFPIPKACPVCAGKVLKEKEEDVAYRCINPVCPAQLERALLHFGSRDALDIAGLGESVVSQLVKLKLVSNFSDLYKLTKEDLLKLELFKDKKADNLISSIQKSKMQPLTRLIYGLGIRHVGEKAAYVLAMQFKDLDKLISSPKEELDSIYEVGPVVAESIVNYFSLVQVKKMIEELRQAGLNFKEKAGETLFAKLAGKNIVFTGELKEFSRNQAKDYARRLGGNVLDSVSKNTDFVVAGENPGSKYDKARALDVKIIDEKVFKEMIK